MTVSFDGCYYKNGEVHCTDEKKIGVQAELSDWTLQGCFCVDGDGNMTKCDGSERGTFAVFVNPDDCQIIIIPDIGGFCH